jgi:hypothetical protein
MSLRKRELTSERSPLPHWAIDTLRDARERSINFATA